VGMTVLIVIAVALLARSRRDAPDDEP
jgi:hypothetical protein